MHKINRSLICISTVIYLFWTPGHVDHDAADPSPVPNRMKSQEKCYTLEPLLWLWTRGLGGEDGWGSVEREREYTTKKLLLPIPGCTSYILGVWLIWLQVLTGKE